jgi:hypothetical protein
LTKEKTIDYKIKEKKLSGRMKSQRIPFQPSVKSSSKEPPFDI